MNNKLPAFLLTGLSVVVPNVAVSDQFTIALIPDTQMLVEQNPHVFFAQMDWIVRNKDTRDIVYVAHLGDLKDDRDCDIKNVRNPETGLTVDEWDIVDWGFAKLDRAGVPYGVVPGNHDYEQVSGGCLAGEPSNPGDRVLTEYDGLFGPGVVRGVSRMDKKPWYGDFGGGERGNRLNNSNDDNFTLFGRCGINFIAINLGYRSLGYLDNGVQACTTGPDPFANGCQLRDGSNQVLTDTEIHWVDDLLTTYSDRLAIITSHYIVDSNAGVPVANRNGFGGYGDQLYHFIKGNRNLFLMLSAHEFGEAWRTEVRASDADGFDPDLPAVQAMLADYQQVNYPQNATTAAAFQNLSTTSFGDGGFMRLLTFDTVTGEVTIETFSPGQVRNPNDTTPLDATDPGSFLANRANDLFSLHNPQTVPFTNVGNSMNEQTASSGFKIRYDSGFTTPAMAINCATVKSQPVQLDNGAFDVSGFDSATLNITSVGTSADFNSSYGYYITDADANPVSGQIIYANVKTASAAPVQVDLSNVPGAALLGFFIVPDGASRNSSQLLSNGAAVTFTQVGGNWVPQINGTTLAGASASAFYSTPSLNANNVAYMTGSETFQGWEDLLGGGDQDFNDVTVSLSNVTGNSH